jgi:hypothetical protein
MEWYFYESDIIGKPFLQHEKMPPFLGVARLA